MHYGKNSFPISSAVRASKMLLQTWIHLVLLRNKLKRILDLVKNIILREISTERSPVSVYRAWGWAGWWVQESPHNYVQGVTQRGSNQCANHWKTGVERGGRP